MSDSTGFVYPRDCVHLLLEEMGKHDQKDPPESHRAEGNNRCRQRYYPWPSPEQMQLLLEVAFAASMEPEEGGLRRFSLGFVSPEGLSPAYYDACKFSKPKELDPKNVAKIAPAADLERSFLAIKPGGSRDRLEIWGVVHKRRPPVLGETTKGKSAFLRDEFFSVRVHGPGVFLVNHWCRLHLAYVRGKDYWSVESSRLHDFLIEGASVDGFVAQEISFVVERMVELGTGGTLLITNPTCDVDRELLDLGYPFDPPSQDFKFAVNAANLDEAGANGIDLDSRVWALRDFVADLTKVDGAVHIASDLTIHGFGGKVMQGVRSGTRLTKADPKAPGTVLEASLERDYRGMRHRSALQFCSNQEGRAFAIVVSQDGDVTLVGRRDDGSVHKIGPFALGIGVAM
jgi:hypothetical protein